MLNLCKKNESIFWDFNPDPLVHFMTLKKFYNFYTLYNLIYMKKYVKNVFNYFFFF
jgi:hypothetical protein